MAVKDNKNGTFTIDYRDAQHRRHRETLFGSKTMGKALLAKRKSAIAEGTYFPEKHQNTLTFREAADKYWEIHLSKKKSGPKTKSTLNQLKGYFGDKPLTQITTEDVQRYYNEKMAQTCAPTANRHFTTFNAIVNKAIKLEIYKGENPCIGVAKQKENPARTRYLEKDQIPLLLAHIPKRSQALVAFAIATGMRRGEILGLNWKDINLEHNLIHVHESKSGYSREIPIMSSLKDILLGLSQSPNGKVFPITVKELEHDFAYGLKKSGLQDIHFHDLRHTFASHFMMNGGSITDLQRILGHCTLALTQRYAHFSPAYLSKSISVVENLIPQLA